MPFGYHGAYLRIDVSSGEARRLTLSEGLLRNYIGGSGLWGLLFPMIGGLLVTMVTVRYGLLALVIARVVWNVIYTMPMMPDASLWSAAAGNWTIALLIALTLWAFYASRAGQPLLGSILKE